MMATPVALVVFDLDGTLVDSKRDLADAANTVLIECGAAPLQEETIAGMVGDGAAALVARAFAKAGIAQPPDALARFLERYGRRLTVHTRPYLGIPAALATLKERSRLALLTNKPLEATRLVLCGLDLAQYFDERFVIGGDGPHGRKPDPAGLLALMRLAGAAPSATVLVGDSVIDWKTARAAGTQLCVARYGFGFDGFSLDELAPGDAVVDSPAELMTTL